MRKFLVILPLIALALPLFGSKKTSGDMKTVDSGSFGIFRAGQRIATETFRIEQSASESKTHSEIKASDSGSQIAQSSDLELSSSGNLLKYSWREMSPEKSEFTVEPGDQVLVQHYVSGQSKTKDLPYILPASTSVLDDYFFVHREVLAWRYLASQCAGQSTCKMTAAKIGVVVPHQHTSQVVSMEYKGRENVTVKGAQTQLDHFILHADDLDWSLYLDDSQKLVKVEIPSQQTEAVRD